MMMSAKKWRGLAIAALLGLLALAAVVLFTGHPRVETLEVVGTDGRVHPFTVEIADTSALQERGLMFRAHMDDSRGMLFEFGRSAPVSFWMKNTEIPLDMLYIAADGQVTKIQQNAVPFSLDPLPSDGPVTAVLEINGGLSARLGLTPGARVRHPFFASTN